MHAHDRLVITGALTLETARSVFLEGTQRFQTAHHVTFDFNAVTECDSACLSLLLAFTRVAKRLNKTLSFVGMPDSMHGMIEQFKLGSIITEKESGACS